MYYIVDATPSNRVIPPNTMIGHHTSPLTMEIGRPKEKNIDLMISPTVRVVDQKDIPPNAEGEK